MGRRFTAASADCIEIGTAGLRGLNFTFGTWACVMRRMVDTGANEVNMATNGNVGASGTWGLSTGDIQAYHDGTTQVTGTGAITVNVTRLVGFTKASGTATGRFHQYNFTTNAWTHVAASGTSVNGAATTSLSLGAANAAGASPASCEMWALGIWQGLVMSDNEFKRLAGGGWERYSPSFYTTFSDGREVGDLASSQGRFPAKQTARTGTTRGVNRPPPGFRMTAQRRRR